MSTIFKDLLEENTSADKKQGTVVEQAYGVIKERVVQTGKENISMESIALGLHNNTYSADIVSSMKDKARGVFDMINAVRATTSAKFSKAQESAALGIALMSGKTTDFLSRKVAQGSELKGRYEGATVVTNIGTEGFMERPNLKVSLEYYSREENRNMLPMSINYNLQGARQNEIGELFFPTVTVPADQIGLVVEARIIYLIQDLKRSLSGAPNNNFNRVSILEAYRKSNLINVNTTRAYPIVRTGTVDIDSTANFVPSASVAPYGVSLAGETLLTAPLKFGAKFDLIGLSQTDALLQAGIMDYTDALDPAVRLESIYLQLPGGVVKYAVDSFAGSAFTAVVQGDIRQSQLNMQVNALQASATVTYIDGQTPVAEFANLGSAVARLSVSVFGNITNLNTGTTEINAGALGIASITDVNGNSLALNSTNPLFTALSNTLANAKLIGYDLKAFRTNANKRQRGQLVDQQTFTQVYPIPHLSPLTCLRPLTESDAGDGQQVATLVAATQLAASNDAIDKLFSFASLLKATVNAADAAVIQGQAELGISRELITPAYLETTLNLVTSTSNLTSSDKIADLNAQLFNTIRDMGTQLYYTSGIGIASQVLRGPNASKPVLLIGCDPIVKRYLTILGDPRLAGEPFEFRIAESYNDAMAGKIVISFGTEESLNSAQPDPLHFGCMGWAPEWVMSIPMTRNGQVSNELTVSPRYLHIMNMPVMGVITVSGLSAMLENKAAIDVAVLSGSITPAPAVGP